MERDGMDNKTERDGNGAFFLNTYCRSLLNRIDQTPVTPKQKMLIYMYKLGVCPRISWDLTISSFPLSWIETSLDPLVTKYLKAWLGLAKPADPSRLFLPQNRGLGLPSISGLYKKL